MFYPAVSLHLCGAFCSGSADYLFSPWLREDASRGTGLALTSASYEQTDSVSRGHGIVCVAASCEALVFHAFICVLNRDGKAQFRSFSAVYAGMYTARPDDNIFKSTESGLHMRWMWREVIWSHCAHILRCENLVT